MLKVIVTTVERQVLDIDEVVQITIPTQGGQITILPGHVSLMTALGMGEAFIKVQNQQDLVLFVDGGVAQVENDRVELLTHLAERADELDEAKIEEAKRRAEKLLEERPVDIDLAKIEASLQRELTRLKVARKIRHRSGS